jgi:hypothetical protein
VNARYVVTRCRKSGEFFGPKHASVDGEKTLCGRVVDYRWIIVTNRFDGVVTCRKCIQKGGAE